MCRNYRLVRPELEREIQCKIRENILASAVNKYVLALADIVDIFKLNTSLS